MLLTSMSYNTTAMIQCHCFQNSGTLYMYRMCFWAYFLNYWMANKIWHQHLKKTTVLFWRGWIFMFYLASCSLEVKNQGVLLTCDVILVDNNHNSTDIHPDTPFSINHLGPIAACDLKYKFVYWMLLLPIIAMPSSVLSQVSGLCDGRDWWPISIQQITPAHGAVSAGPGGGAGEGENVYPVPVDIN